MRTSTKAILAGLVALPLICSAAEPPLAAGPLDADKLEADGIFMFDDAYVVALGFALGDYGKDATAVSGLLNNEQLGMGSAGALPFRSTKQSALLAQKKKCGTIGETFARGDCARELGDQVTAYGKAAAQAKFVRVSFRSVTDWDLTKNAASVRNITPYTYTSNSVCMPNAICGGVAQYREMAGHNYMVCLRLPATYKPNLLAAIPEPQARAVSEKFGGLGATKNSMVFEITQPVKTLAQPAACTDSGSGNNKLVAVGAIEPRLLLLGDAKQAGAVSKDLTFVANR